MANIFRIRRRRVSLSGMLLMLFMSVSIGQYTISGEVTWLTSAFRWLHHSSADFTHDPTVVLEKVNARFDSLYADTAEKLSQGVSVATDVVNRPSLAPQEFDLSGRVVKVTDGDTITLLDDNEAQHKIRLHGIDTPEYRQPYGRAAKDAMARLVAGRTVGVEVKGTDRYGRTVGIVYVDNVNANREIVRAGYAWWYRQYARFDDELEEAEAAARKIGNGLWTEEEPIPPWEWRRGTR